MPCRVCDSERLELALDLGQQPWCNHFLKPEEAGAEPRYPLRLVYCHDCATPQLDHTVAKEVMFGDHTYLSGVTRTLSDHFREVAREVDQRFGHLGRTILDIGSNDGTTLRHFQDLSWDVLGVESSRSVARRAVEQGIPTVNEFFALPMARALGRRFDVIHASGVFFHLEELHPVTEAIREVLRPDGVFVVEFLYMKTIVENLAFDQIYHEHLLYYNLANLRHLLRRHGLDLFDARFSPIHGGSIIGFAGHAGAHSPSERLQALQAAEDAAGANRFQTYLDFAGRVEKAREENLAFLRQRRAEGKTIFGMGAPVKGNTLLNYFGVGPDLIQVLVEKNPMRRGLLAPGSHIPVVMEGDVTSPPDVYYVLAWNFKKEILKNHQDLLEQGVEFYFPVNPKEDNA